MPQHHTTNPGTPQTRLRPGEVVQMGYVVANLDRALAHWTTRLGVGPFLVAKQIEYAELFWQEKAIAIETSVALASHGGMQIELIQQTGGDASMFTEFLARKGGGLHHICVLSDDITRDLVGWRETGTNVLMQGRTKAGILFAYLDSDPDDEGRIVELVQPTPGLHKFFSKLDALSEDWDGSDPVRYL